MTTQRPVLPILYVGRDLTRARYESLRAHRVGVMVAEDAARARRMLEHFEVGAIVVATADLRSLGELLDVSIPIVVLAARDAACDLDGVTIVRRGVDAQELAAVLHGVVRRDLRGEAAGRTAA